MIIDINAYLGHWPFRRLRNNSADGLLRLMDENGIDKAVVSSINAVFYKNSHSGNEELAAETKPHRDRLIPIATLNPQYPGWHDDLRQCHEDFGMVGIRLFPQYHNYSLDNEPALAMIRECIEKDMALSIPIRIVDRRQRHWLDTAADVSLAEIEATMRKNPDGKFCILNGSGLLRSWLVKDEKLKKTRFLMDISRLSVVLQEEVPKLIDLLGESKLAFGTGIPFKYPVPALLKMDVLDVSKEVKEHVLWKNAAAMFLPGINDYA